jgi:hypothetical protein
MKIYYKWMPGKKKSEVDELDDLEFSEGQQAGADGVQIRKETATPNTPKQITC